MFNKKFLKGSPVIWAYAALLITLLLLVTSAVGKEWYQVGILTILALWIFMCTQKDYTIWKLTRK